MDRPETLLNGWSFVKLSKIIQDLPSGVSVNGEDRSADPSEAGVLKVSSVSNGRFFPSENKVIRGTEVERARMPVSRGDLLISRSNTFDLVGASGMVKENAPNLYLPDKLWKVVLKDPTKDNLEWLLQLLNSSSMRQSLKNIATGTSGSMKNISKPSFLSIRVLRPTFPEQQKIAAILSTWDRAIELTEKLIVAKQKRKQALMQQLLTGDFRLSKFAKGTQTDFDGIVRIPAAVRRGIYPPSVQPGIPKLADPPNGWKRKKMADLLHIEKRSVRLEDDTEYQLVVAKRNRGGIEPRERLLGRDIKTPTQFEVRGGDFLISRRQIIHGACGVVPASLNGAIVSNEYSVCTVNGELDMTFLKYLTHSLYFQQTCFHASVGVALEKMIFKIEQWLMFPFLIPPIEEQRAIAAVLVTADLEIDLLNKRYLLLNTQKNGLMQQLLTGNTRVIPVSERKTDA
ncbi:hypothetical protein F1728_06575 [Gimesia benthica]|uniref:Type I restriction modification DNA specificity domain-containing protein n=1 Tax=Gimesia benthica TaxID=2608982 RepID=A0A6I6A7L3_9PLAN|nr:restriction endonuclease subunit S [Gimesia benthica]QGQ22357.1 hypothetical protein F1728_06575 [Gimesia benthica]